LKALVGSEVIEDGIHPVFIEALDDGKIGLRIGRRPREGVAAAQW